VDIIIVPGIGNSGKDHWQSLWQDKMPRARRIRPSDWDRPYLDDWLSALDAAVGEATEPPVLVAHSLGCLLVAQWQSISAAPAAGAFLVAVPDPASACFPPEAKGFSAGPSTPMRFPSLCIASSNDPYAAIGYAKARAAAWNSALKILDNAGHINAASGFGPWPEGEALLTGFMQTL
jgi:predicted alpha/beta hydrolase family esterase